VSFATADLCDAHGDALQLLALPGRSYGGRRAFAGEIATATAPADNSRVRELLQEPGRGRVLVVDGGGALAHALLGDMLASMAVANGWNGVVVYGAVRDVDVLATLDLGVLALGSCPRKTERRGRGERDVELRVAGSSLRPGQWLYADADGVVVAERGLA
jgi:regulator of ribonuclease activity A